VLNHFAIEYLINDVLNSSYLAVALLSRVVIDTPIKILSWLSIAKPNAWEADGGLCLNQ